MGTVDGFQGFGDVALDKDELLLRLVGDVSGDPRMAAGREEAADRLLADQEFYPAGRPADRKFMAMVLTMCAAVLLKRGWMVVADGLADAIVKLSWGHMRRMRANGLSLVELFGDESAPSLS